MNKRSNHKILMDNGGSIVFVEKCRSVGPSELIGGFKSMREVADALVTEEDFLPLNEKIETDEL